MTEATFSGRQTKPFTVSRHTVFGVNNNPQIKFTSV